MEKSLVISNQEVGIMIPPEETIESASQAAKALKRVVSLKTKPVILNGEQYLEFEDLQLLGQFYGYTVKTGDAVEIEIDGVKGAKARADLVNFRTGEIIGGAEAYCMRDEEKWNTRPKYEWQGEGDNRKRIKVGDEVVPWFQLASMAQTRAGAKAFRNRLAWVVVLAGYKPTPAEEMTEGTISSVVEARRTIDKSEHYCDLHNVNFFKSGKMRGYAHKLPDGGWCNETEAGSVEVPKAEKKKPEEQQETPPPPAETVFYPDAELDSIIDLVWLKEQQDELLARGITSWDNKGLRDRIDKITGSKSAKVSEAINKLSKEQAEGLIKQIQETLEMA